MKHKGKLFSVICAFEVAVLFFPAHFIQRVVGLAEPGGIISLGLIPIVCGGLCFAAVCSDSVKTALLKIVLSFPFTVIFRQVQIRAELHIRALNWIHPGYGKFSAGGNFAGFVELLFLAAAILTGFIAAGMVSEFVKNEKAIHVISAVQKYAVPAVSAAVIAAVLLINSMMPPYRPELIYV